MAASASAAGVLRSVLKFLVETNRFDRTMKSVQVVSASQGKCVCEMTVDESHLNRIGTLHGGMTATLLDTVSTLAIMSHENNHPGVSVDLNVSYLNAAKLGDVLEVRSECIKKGKKLAFATVEIIRKNDNSLIAVGRQTKSFK